MIVTLKETTTRIQKECLRLFLLFFRLGKSEGRTAKISFNHNSDKILDKYYSKLINYNICIMLKHNTPSNTRKKTETHRS